MFNAHKSNITGIGALDSINETGSYLSAFSEVQNTISANIANAQTPGYTKKTANFSEVMANMANPYEPPIAQQMGHNKSLTTDTGQPVNLQQELIDMQKNQLYFSMYTRLLTSEITGLKTAAQVGR